MENKKISFLAGFDAVRSGEITQELTRREIERQFPDYQITAFALGMIDALEDDAWRYNRLKTEG